MALTKKDETRIRTLRTAGVAYGKIASFLDLNANTVKTWCRRAGITPNSDAPPVVDPVGVWCRHCTTPLDGVRPAKCCSQK